MVGHALYSHSRVRGCSGPLWVDPAVLTWQGKKKSSLLNVYYALPIVFSALHSAQKMQRLREEEEEGEEDPDDASRPVKAWVGDDQDIHVVERTTQRDVPMDEAVDRYSEDVFRVIMRGPGITYTRLGLYERTSQTVRNWIQRTQLWAALCYRDYPQAYIRAKSPTGPELSPVLTILIDKMSQKPGRPLTYWKRFYELLLKTARFA